VVVTSTTVAVVVVVAVATVAVVVGVVLVLVRRLREVAHDLSELERSIGPALQGLQRDADVTTQELARVSSALDELADGRRRRRDR
jgi:uncharacterized protein YoxC